mmetsp:Transcript_28444/g.28762  ORF Transcript_28444/g.28762 Transcript_28444/m.28762 type:complete len:221 (-) Transcript_28444:8-670(-)
MEIRSTSIPFFFASCSCSFMWIKSFSLHAPLITIPISSPRLVIIVSSIIPPFSFVISDKPPVYGAIPATSATTSVSRNATRSFPLMRTCPMCETSNRPALDRVHKCVSLIPSGYCTGRQYPANGTIFPPSSTCFSYNAVLFNSADPHIPRTDPNKPALLRAAANLCPPYCRCNTPITLATEPFIIAMNLPSTENKSLSESRSTRRFYTADRSQSQIAILY